jgi:hypothetical protein
MNKIESFLRNVEGLVVALAAIVGGLAYLVKEGRKLGGPFTVRLRKLWKSRWTPAAVAVILFGGALLAVRSVIPPPCSPTNLSIISPTDGAVVSQSQPVFGTINHLCPGQYLWLVFQSGGPGGGGYYPQNEVAVASNAKRWSTAAYFGQASKSDNGRPFTALVVIANDSTNRQFQEYLASGKVTHNFPGLADLGGAAIVSEIKVTRGPYLPP